MWYGVMFSISGFNITRDTNSNVESWFNIVKSVCKTKNRRPSAFVINCHKLVFARIAESKYPGGRKPKSKADRKRPNEETLSQAEELWARKYLLDTCQVKSMNSFRTLRNGESM
ncbi:hypothetical protein ACF0H5_002323 [Mactra antiquata]